MNILFVCTANINRSPTAERIFGKKYNTKSAGTGLLSRKKLNKDMIEWADIIFVMEDIHKDYIKKHFPEEFEKKKIIVLNIPDIYPFNNAYLIKSLKEKVKGYL